MIFSIYLLNFMYKVETYNSPNWQADKSSSVVRIVNSLAIWRVGKWLSGALALDIVFQIFLLKVYKNYSLILLVKWIFSHEYFIMMKDLVNRLKDFICYFDFFHLFKLKTVTEQFCGFLLLVVWLDGWMVYMICIFASK